MASLISAALTGEQSTITQAPRPPGRRLPMRTPRDGNPVGTAGARPVQPERTPETRFTIIRQLNRSRDWHGTSARSRAHHPPVLSLFSGVSRSTFSASMKKTRPRFKPAETNGLPAHAGVGRVQRNSQSQITSVGCQPSSHLPDADVRNDPRAHSWSEHNAEVLIGLLLQGPIQKRPDYKYAATALAEPIDGGQTDDR